MAGLVTLVACASLFIADRDRAPGRMITADDINLFAPLDYSELKSEGFSPRKGAEAVPFGLPFDWNADPFADRNWQFQISAWRGIDVILAEYFRSGDVVYLAEAAAYAADWARFYRTNDPGPMTWSDMATGLRALRLALFIDAEKRGFLRLSEDDLRLLRWASAQHVQRLHQESFINTSNHGVPQVFGLDLLCTVLRIKDGCRGAHGFARRMFDRIVEASFTGEGVHKEHSPGYHLYTTKLIDRLGPDRLHTRGSEIIARARALFPWMTLPDGRVIPVGDSRGNGPKLTKADRVDILSDGGRFAVGDFTLSGYASVRTAPGEGKPQSLLFVTGMANSLAHRHADDLSFVLYERDQLVFSDAGVYGYNIDERRQFVQSARAHSTISLEDEEIGPRDVEFVGSELRPIDRTGDFFVVRGRTVRPGKFTQEREIRYRPGRELFINDHVTADGERRFVSTLVLARNLVPIPVQNGFEIVLSDETVVRATLANNSCRMEYVRGRSDPMLGWETTAYLKLDPATVVRATCPGRDVEIGWHITLQ